MKARAKKVALTAAMAMLSTQESALMRTLFELWRSDWHVAAKRQAKDRALQHAAVCVLRSQTAMLTTTCFSLWKEVWQAEATAHWLSATDGNTRAEMHEAVQKTQERF